MTSIGKYRHLMRCSDADGFFTMLAIDHRANLREQLEQQQPITDDEFVAFKQTIIQAVLPQSTALLADPDFGIGAGIAERRIPGQIGLLSPIEVTDYGLHPSKRTMELIPNWTVEKIKLMGGDGIKMLLPYHPEDDNSDKLTYVQSIIDDCTKYDLPYFLEPIAYSRNPEQPLSNTELLEIMIEMAKTFSEMGVDVLKLQFPVDAKQSRDESEWLSACEAVTAACTVPWALLSAGVDYDTFAIQARIACESGASGVIVGRAVWKDAVSLNGDERHAFLNKIAVPRMAELNAICREHATPWWEGVTAPESNIGWYTDYNE